MPTLREIRERKRREKEERAKAELVADQVENYRHFLHLTREQQAKRGDTVINMYKAGDSIKDIQEVTGYTQGRVYQLLKEAKIPARAKNADSEEVKALVKSGYCRLKTEAAFILGRIETFDKRPNFCIDKVGLKMIGIGPKREKETAAALKKIGLFIGLVPFPHLYQPANHSYYPLTFKELVALHNNTTLFLTTNAPKIKAGWKSTLNGFTRN